MTNNGDVMIDRVPWLLQQWQFHRLRSGFKKMKFPKPHKENHEWHVSQMNFYFIEMQKLTKCTKWLEPKPYHLYKYDKR